jgi:replicative DNA helicase
MAKFVLPSNVEAEKAVLGAMIMSPDALNDALGSLNEDSFFGKDSPNSNVFLAIRHLQDKRIPCDVQTITEELINMKKLDLIGGTAYLLELCDSAISFSNLEHYIKIVKDQAVLRRLLLTMDGIKEDYTNKEIEDISDFVANANEKISKVAEERTVSTFLTSEEIAGRVKESLDHIKASSDGLIGLTTGYKYIDSCTLGLQKSDMIVVAARPSVGKTQLSLNIAYNAASAKNIPVAIFELEMPADMLIKRLIACRSSVNLKKILNGNFNPQEKFKINEAIGELSRTQIYIDDSPCIRLVDIITKARKLKAKCPDLGLVVVDYIGLISTGEKKVENRQQEVSNISRSLKELARELKCPVIVVCQLSRDSDKRDNKKPILSDLRESGAIEQDADVVMLLHDESRFKAPRYIDKVKGSKMNDNEKQMKSKELAMKRLYESLGENVVDITVIIAKNRNGETRDVDLHFFKNYGRFDDPSDNFVAEKERIAQMSDSGDDDIK